MAKAGQAQSLDTGSVGREHPLPENIPHLSSPGVGSASQGGSGNGNMALGVNVAQSGSPVKESSFLSRETSVNEAEAEEKKAGEKEESVSPPPMKEGIPIKG